MLRTFRAFAWLRWRILVHALQGSGSRDRLERLSIATGQLVPILAILVLLPSAVAVLAVSGLAGWDLASGATGGRAVEAVRLVLLAGSGLAVAGPLLLPAGARTPAVRLLLLPIPRALLYAGTLASALADPWMILVGAAAAGVSAGLAGGGAMMPAALAALAGLCLLLALAGLSALVTHGVQLALRNRRRGELLGLLLLLSLPFVAFLPSLPRGAPANVDDVPAAGPDIRHRVTSAAGAAIPSELFVAVAGRAAREGGAAAAAPLAGLAAGAGLVHLAAYALFSRMLRSPGVSATSGRRRASSAGPAIPGLSVPAAAVAWNQVRLALRTPRGRAALLTPLVFAALAVLLVRGRAGADLGYLRLVTGIEVAALGSAVALLAVVPLAMNQFAIDRGGLTRHLLAPLPTRTLLAGKAAGNAIVVSIPAGMSLALAAALVPSGPVALWLSVPAGLAAALLLATPIAAVLSAIFPRSVDLNSIGGGSNAHGAAALLGTLACAAFASPPVLLVVLAVHVLDRPWLAPLLLLAWTVCCAAISALLFRMACALFDRRRDNLPMTQ